MEEGKDLEAAITADKVASEISKNESATIMNIERAEKEQTKNEFSVYTSELDLDAKQLQNQQTLQLLQQPQKRNNDATKQAGSTELSQQPSAPTNAKEYERAERRRHIRAKP